jgi:hypothetical protein
VLAGSAAYALGEGLGGTTGLGRRPLDAKAFYCTIAVATLIGMLINLVGIDPIKTGFGRIEAFGDHPPTGAEFLDQSAGQRVLHQIVVCPFAVARERPRIAYQSRDLLFDESVKFGIGHSSRVDRHALWIDLTSTM